MENTDNTRAELLRKKRSVLVPYEVFRAFRSRPAKDCQKFFLALYDYARNGVIAEWDDPEWDDPDLSELWDEAITEIKANIESYISRVERAQKGAQKRWGNKGENA